MKAIWTSLWLKKMICALSFSQLGYFQSSVIMHYNDVIMGAIASQITSLTIVYSTVYSGADHRKHQSSASLAFVRGIHRGPVNSLHKWPVTRKMFPFDDVFMEPCHTGCWLTVISCEVLNSGCQGLMQGKFSGIYYKLIKIKTCCVVTDWLGLTLLSFWDTESPYMTTPSSWHIIGETDSGSLKQSPMLQW